MHTNDLILRATSAAAAGLLLMALTACRADEARPAADIGGACLPEGELRTRLYGGLEATLNWDAADLECEGMPRPAGAGARLRFAGLARVDGDVHRMTFIIALPDLQRGRRQAELPATVTLIEEDAGRFFSTQDLDVCWANIERHYPLGDDPRAGSFGIDGLLYCVAPLTELNGSSSVTLGDLHFAGQVNWEPPE